MKAARRIERERRVRSQGLVAKEGQDRQMKAAILRLAATFGAIALTAIAGGASLRGF
jgi:hypothetical protein